MCIHTLGTDIPRERENERERERERQTDRQTETETETDRQTDRQTETETERLYLPVTGETGRLIHKDTQRVPLNHRQQVADGSVHV